MEFNKSELLKEYAIEAVKKYYDDLFIELDKKKMSKVIYRTEDGKETVFSYPEFVLPFVLMNKISQRQCLPL